MLKYLLKADQRLAENQTETLIETLQVSRRQNLKSTLPDHVLPSNTLIYENVFLQQCVSFKTPETFEQSGSFYN